MSSKHRHRVTRIIESCASSRVSQMQTSDQSAAYQESTEEMQAPDSSQPGLISHDVPGMVSTTIRFQQPPAAALVNNLERRRPCGTTSTVDVPPAVRCPFPMPPAFGQAQGASFAHRCGAPGSCHITTTAELLIRAASGLSYCSMNAAVLSCFQWHDPISKGLLRALAREDLALGMVGCPPLPHLLCVTWFELLHPLSP